MKLLFKFFVAIFCFLIIGFLIYIFSNRYSAVDATFIFEGQEYVEFKPVYFNDKSTGKANMYLVSDDVPIDFQQKLSFVLSFYNVLYKEKDGQIFVKTDVWSDKDYMANMTLKALDDDWLLSRGYINEQDQN